MALSTLNRLALPTMRRALAVTASAVQPQAQRTVDGSSTAQKAPSAPHVARHSTYAYFMNPEETVKFPPINLNSLWTNTAIETKGQLTQQKCYYLSENEHITIEEKFSLVKAGNRKEHTLAKSVYTVVSGSTTAKNLFMVIEREIRNNDTPGNFRHKLWQFKREGRPLTREVATLVETLMNRSLNPSGD